MIAIAVLLSMLTGLFVGAVAGASWGGLAVFALLGLVGGLIAVTRERGSEGIYWAALALTLVLLGLALAGVTVPGLVMVAPITLAIACFAARTLLRLLPTRSSVR